MKFFIRNAKYSIAHPRRAYATRKAMGRYRKKFPECELTGRTPIHVHHKEPVHVCPERAADEGNMISLHSKVHFVLGHGCNWRHWVPNVEHLVMLAKIRTETR